jgi:hypothetical protein
METGKFWFIVIFTCLVVAVFSGVQYFQGVDTANAHVVETRSKLSQVKETLALRQDEWTKISVLAAEAQAAASKEAPLKARRDELANQFRRLEGDFKYLVKSTRAAVNKIRAEGEGAEFPEVKLLNGKVLKAAKIKKVEPNQLSFMHSEGYNIVTYDLLPDELRERFDMGESGLADELEDAERRLFTQKK